MNKILEFIKKDSVLSKIYSINNSMFFLCYMILNPIIVSNLKNEYIKFILNFILIITIILIFVITVMRFLFYYNKINKE